MVELPAVITTLRQRMPFLQEHYAVQSLGVFGSYVRQKQHADSDLDVLVSFRETPGLITFLELEYYLSDLLGVTVDLVLATALKPAIGEAIRHEVLTL